MTQTTTHEYVITTDGFQYATTAASLDEAIEEAFLDEIKGIVDEDTLHEKFARFVADGGWCWIEEDDVRVLKINC